MDAVVNIVAENDSDGNTVIVGKGASETAKDFLEALFPQDLNLVIDYEGVEFRATIDSEYRLLNQTAKLSASMNMPPVSASISISTVTTYDYGDQYAISAPTDADAYTQVDSLDKLYSLD